MWSLREKVVLITGASRGVGAACAVALARKGARLVLAAKTMEPDPRLPGTLIETAQAVEAAGGEAHVVAFDARDSDACTELVERTVERFGGIDVLVNNAGAIFWAPVANWSVKRFDLVFGVNMRASFALSRAAIPHMRARGGGHILMMSPPIVSAALAGKAPYLVSKWGMTALAMAIDAEESDHGISASALWPVTGIRTAATENLGMGSASEWRKPDILADATVMLLERDPAHARFRAWLDEEVLAEGGITDLTGYRCDPNAEPMPMSIELVDPGWAARNGRA
ncbi:short chain dehydrogenase [Deltaproteobacteria bacterium]|nr:short chain dehydrogenase [Deltaproteobacteria bacterium]